MTLLTAISAFFILLLIIVGGIFTAEYEQAPLWERVHVLGVGIGMCAGIVGMFLV